PHRPRGLRAARPRRLPPLQEGVRRVLLPRPPRRAARHRRAVLRRSRRAGLPDLPRVLEERRRALPARVRADRGTPQGDAVRRARAELPALPARPLRRIQPRVRPRHALRPPVGRPCGVDPRLDAAARGLALRLEARAGLAGGAPLQRLPAPARLGLSAAPPRSPPPAAAFWRRTDGRDIHGASRREGGAHGGVGMHVAVRVVVWLAAGPAGGVAIGWAVAAARARRAGRGRGERGGLSGPDGGGRDAGHLVRGGAPRWGVLA